VVGTQRVTPLAFGFRRPVIYSVHAGTKVCWAAKQPATQAQLNQAAWHEAIVLEDATDAIAVPGRGQPTATTRAFRCTTWVTEMFGLLVV
jgi:hypothetical protein